MLKIEQISEQLLPLCQEHMDDWRGCSLDTSIQINALQFLGLTPLKITQDDCDREALKLSKALAFGWLEWLSLSSGTVLAPNLLPACSGEQHQEFLSSFKSVISGMLTSFQEDSPNSKRIWRIF